MSDNGQGKFLLDERAELATLLADLAIEVDAKGCVAGVRQGDPRDFGLEAEDLIGKPLDQILEPIDPPPSDGRLVPAALRREGREPLRVASASLPAATAEGSPGTVVVVRVAERTPGEAGLAALVEDAPEAVAAFRIDGRTAYVNAAGRRLVGLASGDDITTFLLSDILIGNDAAGNGSEFLERVQSEGYATGWTMVRPLDGRPEFPVEYSALVLPAAGASGEPQIGLVARDATDRFRLELRIQEQQRMESFGDLASAVARVFTRQLSVILGHATLALDEHEGRDAELEDTLQQIERAAIQGADFVRDLEAYAGQSHAVTACFDLEALVARSAELFKGLLPPGVELRIEASEAAASVEMDPQAAQQMLLQLVRHAAVAVGTGPGVVTVRTEARDLTEAELEHFLFGAEREEGRYVVLEVSDTGGGIAEGLRQRMFDPFFSMQGKRGVVGLAAVAGTIRNAQGALGVDSREGEGATVTVLVPISDVHAIAEAQPPEPAEIPAWDSGGVILIADDEPEMREILHRILEARGLEVVEASDGLQAVEAFRARPDQFLAVILDVRMPRLDGWRALEQIQAIRGDVPIILSTAYGEPPEEPLHATGVIQKPYRAHELIAELDRCLGLDSRGEPGPGRR